MLRSLPPWLLAFLNTFRSALGGLSPRRRRRLRRLAPALLLAALAGGHPTLLLLLPLLLPLALLGAVLTPPSGGYPLSVGLHSWSSGLAAGGNDALPLLLWFRYPGAGEELGELLALGRFRRALALLRGLLRLVVYALGRWWHNPEYLESGELTLTLLRELGTGLATALPLALATLAPELSAVGSGPGSMAAAALALLLRGYALQGEVASSILFALLPSLLSQFLALVASLMQLPSVLPGLWRLWRWRGLAPDLPALLPFYHRWLAAHPQPGGPELAAWTERFFIPYFEALQDWLAGPLAREINGWLAFGNSPGPLPALEGFLEECEPWQGLLRSLVALARWYYGDGPEPSPLLGLFLALILWLPLRLFLAALGRFLERRSPLGKGVAPAFPPPAENPLPPPAGCH